MIATTPGRAERIALVVDILVHPVAESGTTRAQVGTAITHAQIVSPHALNEIAHVLRWKADIALPEKGPVFEVYRASYR